MTSTRRSALLLCALAAACGGDAATYSVGGTVSGLTGGGLVLTLNGGADLAVDADGQFAFADELADGTAYTVAVQAQPAGQLCTIAGASGTIAGADVTDVAVSCGERRYTVGGSVSGLAGSGLVLQLDGGGDLAIDADGAFVFAAQLADGAAYEVLVAAQPSDPAQTCTVANGSGTVQGASVTDVEVSCAGKTTFTVGGQVGGLSGAGLVLELNGDEELAVDGDGPFVFTAELADGADYDVVVLAQPEGQLCAVSGGSGVIAGADVTDVAVDCADGYTVGGSVVGLVGADMVLQLNGTVLLAIDGDGPFTFPVALGDGDSYEVTIFTPPHDPAQECALSGGSGTIAGGDVIDVVVSCPTTALFPVAGRNWNDYIRNDGATPLLASGAPCSPVDDGPGYAACLHGGELRAFPVPGRTSCAGLTASDSLGAFAWTCDASAGVRMVSTGLAAGLGLADLVDFDALAWRTISLTVRDGAGVVLTTEPAAWWENPIASAAAGVSAGTALEGTIFVIADDAGADVTLDADRTALVIRPGAVLQGRVRETGAFLWLEGELDASAEAIAIDATGVAFSRFNNLAVSGASTYGVCLQIGSDNNLLTGIAAIDNGINVFLNFASNNTLDDVTATAGSSDGVRLTMSDGCTLSGVTAEDNLGKGIYLDNSAGAHLTAIEAVGSGDEGVHVQLSPSTEIDGLVAADNGAAGLYLDRSDDCAVADAELTGNGEPAGLRLDGNARGRLAGVIASNNAAAGVQLTDAVGNRLSGLQVAQNGTHGVYLTGSTEQNLITDLVASDNQRKGLYVTNAINNTFAGVVVANHPEEGVFIASSHSNRLFQITATGNDAGIVFGTGTNNVLLGATAANNRFIGVRLGDSSTDNLVAGVASANNGDVGMYFLTSAANTVIDLVGADNGTNGVSMNGDNAVTFRGVLKVGGNASGDCQVAPMSTGIDGACAPTGGSDALLTTGVSTATAFAGRVTTDDALNQSDLAGSRPYAQITDWTRFDSAFRAWGRAATAFPAAAARANCAGGDTCQIWDWALTAADAVARAVGPALPTGANALTHTWRLVTPPASQADCDAALPGSTFSAAACRTTFLRGAAEVMGDGLGNENTLCESGETCLVTPNAGSYQGDGALVSAGAFVPGALTGITLVRHAQNGR